MSEELERACKRLNFTMEHSYTSFQGDRSYKLYKTFQVQNITRNENTFRTLKKVCFKQKDRILNEIISIRFHSVTYCVLVICFIQISSLIVTF